MCGWLQEQGLGLYVAPCQSWIKSGQSLLEASQQDLEKVRPPPVGGEVSDHRLNFEKTLSYIFVWTRSKENRENLQIFDTSYVTYCQWFSDTVWRDYFI